MAGNRLKMALGETATKSSRKRAASSSEDAAEKDAAEGECKRTKLPPPGRTIRDALPDSLVAAVCDFLTVPSRLMTALALGGRNGGSIGGTAVVVSSLVGGAPVTSLDFEDVERELAGRLTDDHLESMLRLADAATGLQILKLAGCTNITGSGLRPLRGSRVLRQVDFTLRGNHEAAKEEEEESQLSKEEVVSFLQSLLDGGGTALRDVSFPKAWAGDPAVGQWKENFDQYKAGCQIACSKVDCGNLISSSYHQTCYDCLNMICEPCSDEWDDVNGYPTVHCDKCKRTRCQECTTRQECDSCNYDGEFCSECMPVSKRCRKCGYSFCGAEEGDCRVRECALCEGVTCLECCGYHCTHNIEQCANCERTMCPSCIEFTHCGGYYCDCHPPDFECLWCDQGKSMYKNERQLCEKCRPGLSKTKCTYCHREKLYLKDYPLPDVPSSHWLGRGLTDEYIKEVTDFLRAMQVTTLMLRSPDEVDEYRMEFLQHHKAQLRHDEALVPYWQQFTSALESYDGDLVFGGIELHSSVIDMLGPALATCITSLSLHDVGRGWIDLAIGVIGANSSLKNLSCSANPSRMERAFDLFSSVADHPTLSELTLRKVCSDGAEGYSLFMLAKICLLDGDSGSAKAYRLDFSGNSMTSNGATHIADAIASNSTRLVKLDLKNNQLTDSDAQAIGQALRGNTTLERLSMQDNELTHVGVAAIHDAVISPGCTFQSILNSEHMVSIDLPYSIGKLCPDFKRKYFYGDEQLTDVEDIERRKICYIFAIRHGSGTNFKLLCKELGDLAAKLLPFAIKQVFDCSHKYLAGNHNVGKLNWCRCREEQHVPPLSIAHEILRSWEVTKQEY